MEIIDGNWIAARLVGRHGEKKALADFVGIDTDKLSKIMSGLRKVQIEEAPRFVAYFASSGREIEESPAEYRRVERHEQAEPGTDLVPVFDVAASAGFGAVVGYESVAYSLAFPPDYIRRLTRANPRDLVIISVKGDSMEPTLRDDDIVMLDTSKTNLSFDGMFVIRFDDVLHVKRVTRSARAGHVVIVSDNRAIYPPIERAAEEVEVIGKVIWKGGKA